MTGYGDNRLQGLSPHGRYRSEMAVTAAMLALFGFINLVPGVYDMCLSTMDGQDWSGSSDVFPPVVLLLSALVQITFSVVSIGVGFQYITCGGACRMWTMASLCCSLCSLFTFAVTVAHIAFVSDKSSFLLIPQQYQASKTEERSVATLVAIGYIAYAANNFVALIYLNYKMFKFESEKWTGFNRAFYQKLLVVFGFFTLLAGVSQLALGAYIYDKVGEDRLTWPIGATFVGDAGFISGPYLVIYSRLALAVGAFQFALGCGIVSRATRKPCDGGGEDTKGLKIFQELAFFVLLVGISIQVLSQASMSSKSGNDMVLFAGWAAQAIAYVVGVGLFPVYLDAMYHTSPELIEPGDFSRVKGGSFVMGKDNVEERKTEAAPIDATAGV